MLIQSLRVHRDKTTQSVLMVQATLPRRRHAHRMRAIS